VTLAQPLISHAVLRLNPKVNFKTERRSRRACKESPRAGITRDHCICILSCICMILREHTGPPPRYKHFSALLWLPRQPEGPNTSVPCQIPMETNPE
jgi:hypothetical protein